jgi:hypothetical protein
MNSMTRVRLIAFALFCLVAGVARGQERQFPEFQCSITPPKGWEALPVQQPALVAAYGSPDRKKSLMLFASKQQKPGPLDYDTINQFESARSSNTNDQRVTSKVVEVGGVRAYDRLGRSMIEGRPATTWVRLFGGNGYFYSIQAMRIDGEAVEDAELRQGMDSLRFPGGPVIRQHGNFGPGLLAAGVVLVAVSVLVIMVWVNRKREEPGEKQKDEAKR